MTEILMRDLSTLDFHMEKATIVKWLKREGEKVEKGEPLYEVETAKVVTEVESPTSGTLTKILVPEGTEVHVGKIIAIIK